MSYNSKLPANWRKYQTGLQKNAKRKHYLRKLLWVMTIVGGLLTVLAILVLTGFRIPENWSWADQELSPSHTDGNPTHQMLTRNDLAVFLTDITGKPLALNDQIFHKNESGRYTIQTTINTKLQNYITRLQNRSRTLQSAVVVLSPYDGRIIAMAGYDANGGTGNLNLKADYPAASLFKIVSAAAALETAGFSPDKSLHFRGRRHTLYKNQLKPTKGRYNTKTTFRKAFALSNNSVFGKMGIYDLGQEVLAGYAEKFFFNKPITFDLPLEVSTIQVPPDEFGLAEIASGFNKKTLISPLHATLLATVAVNGGEMPIPWLVDSIQNEAGNVVYNADPGVLNTAVSSQTATDLKALMHDAVRYGTSRKAFRRLRRKRLFKKFELGAKTGTINDKMDQFKYDWLAAYALAPGGNRGICVGILGVHGKILGTRSTEMGRAIINFYFASKLG
ncbi:MAG: penicillin-binding transpeptidase domain-containing protein [Desulfobacterales bacterium]|jgi:cell division protein FtsI/penicillin-binding protein 2